MSKTFTRTGKALVTVYAVCAVAAVLPRAAVAGELSRSFEFRYVSDDAAADGETDFKGETAVFDTDERVEFLARYGDYARTWYGDPGLDTMPVTEEDARDFLAALKPQPLPRVRRRIPLDGWRWTGHRPGLDSERNAAIVAWRQYPGLESSGGVLKFTADGIEVRRDIPEQSWRMYLRWRVRFRSFGDGVSFSLRGAGGAAADVGFDGDGVPYCVSPGERSRGTAVGTGRWHDCLLEVDFVEGRYNFIVDGVPVGDFVPFAADGVSEVGVFVISGCRGMTMDDITGVGYTPRDDVRRPFGMATFINETFDEYPDMSGWQRPDYDDTLWRPGTLPVVHGGERFAGEDLYLRTKVWAGPFTRAVLDIETLDPGGEVWVNGRVAAVLSDRHPARVDITEHLVSDADNVVAVRVDHFVSPGPMGHSPEDLNVGWFAGRMHIDLMEDTFIDDVFARAVTVSDPADVRVDTAVRNDRPEPFEGSLRITARRWFPTEEERPAAVLRVPVRVRAWSTAVIDTLLAVTTPHLWTPDDPNLYRVDVVLEDGDGGPLDDSVLTTGIRTVDQEGGTFRLNGRPEMLNGAQIMGFRIPMDTIVTWNRCAPATVLARELLQTRRMNGNLLRIHVHAWANPARNINDPRIAEMADQLGMMLIWGTTAWIRSNECWGVDFEGYPLYMKQVRNHPSIVMWEVSNHPNRFKRYDTSESNLFCEKAYATVAPTDMSRIISFTSFIGHLHYGNDLGTVDHEGNPMTPSPAWTAPMVTRGNQDSVTGYGKEWSLLREWPRPYERDFLDSPDRAYFNFEHEESIGQPNWSLARGKPWYRLQSYEWDYDEGSIGRRLTADEWLESQAWQAFSAYEATKKQRLADYDGFSWCCLHGGANSGTYKKPLMDCFGHAKLSWYANRMVFQRVLAGSGDVDVVYGPGDAIGPVVMNLGPERTVDVTVTVGTPDGRTVDTRRYPAVILPPGRTVTRLERFRPDFPKTGFYAVEYVVSDAQR